ncbi:MAG TPA: VOC family protein [Caulobacteraceae bacterium]|jgi:catechol 2,3-dioxygenase-like lactoylglutathione lyase family enzyme|nr:VOC family protein [Caulobacteraceae bacterium]
MASESGHSIGPKRSTWTHIALCVKDIDATIAWYQRFTHLSLLSQGEDKDGKNAWLGDKSQVDSPFVLVLSQFYEGHDPFAPAPHLPMGPFAHIGIELPSREAVDEVAGRAKAEGCLGLGPIQLPKQIGYVCFIKDPDGNTVEFSYDQGVYEKAREVWGKATAAE